MNIKKFIAVIIAKLVVAFKEGKSVETIKNTRVAKNTINVFFELGL